MKVKWLMKSVSHFSLEKKDCDLITPLSWENEDHHELHGFLKESVLYRDEKFTLSTLGKIFSRRYIEIFFFFKFPRKLILTFHWFIVCNNNNNNKNKL